jgi:cobalt/nickel transport system permease protein
MKHDYPDRYSGLDSPLHRLDPRSKIFGFSAAILILVSEPRGELFPFLFYAALIGSLLFLSRIPPPFIVRRCLIAAPFILTAALLLPLSLALEGGSSSGLTAEAWFFSLSIVLKSFSAVTLLILLTSLDKFHRLLKGLRVLGLPPVFGVLAALMYRYIFILNDERLRTQRARISRTPGRLRTGRFRVIGNQAAVIFLRSWERAHLVHQAMLARGFDGSFPEYEGLSFRKRDAVFLWLMILFFLAIRLGV